MTTEELAIELQRYGVTTMTRWATDAAVLLRSQAAEIEALRKQLYTLRNFGPNTMRVMQGPYDHWCAMLEAAPKEQP